MTTIKGPAPGFYRHPDHHIRIRRAFGQWRALLDGKLLAESDNARRLDESGYGAVIYFPPDDVVREALARSDSDTACPFKGRARYFRSARDPGGPDIAWTYPATYNEVADVEGFIAFYEERVSLQNLHTKSREDRSWQK